MNEISLAMETRMGSRHAKNNLSKSPDRARKTISSERERRDRQHDEHLSPPKAAPQPRAVVTDPEILINLCLISKPQVSMKFLDLNSLSKAQLLDLMLNRSNRQQRLVLQLIKTNKRNFKLRQKLDSLKQKYHKTKNAVRTVRSHLDEVETLINSNVGDPPPKVVVVKEM